MAGMKRKSSRKNAENPLVGPSREELPTGDLPTLRDVLAKALWMKEKSIETRNKFTNNMLGLRMMPIIFDGYKRMNSLLKLYLKTSVYNKFIKEWNEFKQLCKTSNKRDKKIYFESKLDK